MVQRTEDKRVTVLKTAVPKLGTPEPELGMCCPVSQTWPPQGIETSADTWPYFPDKLRTR